MIDKETMIFNAVANALHTEYPLIYVIGAEMSPNPPRFPAVSFVQTNNAINSNGITFNKVENVVREEYKAEVFSNLSSGKEAQTKAITAIISGVMLSFGYERTFCQPVVNGDATIARRLSRYVKNNTI